MNSPTGREPSLPTLQRDEIFITRLAEQGQGIAVAIKDLIDLRGTVTTAGSRALAEDASPATEDAPLLHGILDAVERGEAWIVGKTNLHELAFGADGVNPVFGTPVNPLDRRRAPGGSSSGSAVAVATGLADVALGSDTGGSIRIPAACTGTVGLKTSWGRIPLDGVWALSPFLDTVGPMARTVADVVRGMDLLEPGFAAKVPSSARLRIGRVRLPGLTFETGIQQGVDAAVAKLADAGCEVVEVTLPMWDEVHHAGLTVILGEAWRQDRHLLERPGGVTSILETRLRLGRAVTDEQLVAARHMRTIVRPALQTLFETVDVVALPTLVCFPPLLAEAAQAPLTSLTRYANLTGMPALAMPVPVPPVARDARLGDLPASLQLMALPGNDEAVCRAGLLLEAHR